MGVNQTLLPDTVLGVAEAVRQRYSRAAATPERELCCPTSYDPHYLRAIPSEVLERDYGCGDPSHHLQPGETVLDLGSGSGKICFIASEKARLFDEIFRVLRRGGRAVISDIVADEDVPDHLQRDPELWSGCISGALREDRFLHAFEQAGFFGITVAARAGEPWRTVEGIEFRSMTVIAYKGKDGPCVDHKQAVIYRGPFREVVDDDGHTLRRGVRTAVCEKTFRILGGEPYRSHVDLVEPRVPVAAGSARPFPCAKGALIRDPRETKGADYTLTTEATGAVCSGEDGCC